jgi:HK97 family phage prohead protease
MPWHVTDEHPDCAGWAVVKDDDNSVAGCHETKAKANKQLAALYANEESSMTDETTTQRAAPTENLVRAVVPGLELRASDGTGMPTLVGHVAPWDQWAEIDSLFEGHFLERFRKGSFARTIKQQAARIKALFQHGMDPQVGDKPLGPFTALEEDARGLRYEVPLLDTSYNRDLMPGLEAGLYGSSHRFSVIHEDWDWEAEKSSWNPDGIPERTISEARLFELGPVTFPAYEGSAAGIRSMTDEVMLSRLVGADRLPALLSFLRDDPLPAEPEPPAHLETETRDPAPASTHVRFRSREEYIQWIQSISTR